MMHLPSMEITLHYNSKEQECDKNGKCERKLLAENAIALHTGLH